jgi:hypothetical protein
VKRLLQRLLDLYADLARILDELQAGNGARE